MPRLTDKSEIRTLLRRDPAWSLYALGDLAPSMYSKTRWFAPDLTLVVQDYGTTILFAMGPGSVREALECVTGPVHLQVKRDALDEVARRWWPTACFTGSTKARREDPAYCSVSYEATGLRPVVPQQRPVPLGEIRM
jgi:hypothetical protein